MDQSLEVFVKVFTHFTIFGFKNVKINVFGEKKFWCIFIKLKYRCLPTGPGDLKN